MLEDDMTTVSPRRGLAALAFGLTAFAALPVAAAEMINPAFGVTSEIHMPGATYKQSDQFAVSNHQTGGGGGLTINGLAQASLASGTLHSSSSVFLPSGCTPYPYSPCDSYGVTSLATMHDTVHFLKSDGSPIESLGLIPRQISVDGILDGTWAWAKVRVYEGYDANHAFSDDDWITITENNTELLDTLFVPLTEMPMYVKVELWTGAQTNGTVETYSISDFGNTLHYNWVLPEGIIAQSGSGVFLTDVTSAVPEPATWALMITGFGLLGGALRRRTAAFA
jgi:hypothetical protein